MRTLLLAVIMMVGLGLQAQTIYEIQGQQDASPYNGSSVTTSGIVTGVAGDGYFIQDGDGAWNGIYVYDQTQTPAVGDEVSLTAVVDEYYTLTELVNVSSFEVLSSGNTLPNPTLITTQEVNDEDWEGVLIRVEDAVCTTPDMPYGEFEVNDGSGVARVDDMLYLFDAEGGIAYHITGIGHFSFDFYKILPLGPEAVENATPLYFTMNPEEFNISTTGMTIQWQTNAPANSMLAYGTTPAFELGVIESTELVTDHAIELPDLDPATIYYIEVQSSDTENSTQPIERVVCTQSESSGAIDVFFNHSVNTEVATVSEATQSADFVADILSYINLAESTLDVTMYDTQGGDAALFEAFNTLHQNGVQVRLITDVELDNVELDALDSGIPVLAGNSEGIMHDKFLIIDAGSVDNALVMTGSTNWTEGNLGWDFNNVVCIQDQSLAKAYTLEFEEMWGTDESTPDADLARFGSEKTDNTPHKFVLGEVEAELYFSPSDGTEGQIADALLAAENEIAFAIMAFTSNSLGSAIATQHANGLDVQGIIDYVEFNGSEFDFLTGNGVDVIDYQNADGTQWPDGPVLHHKYAIADYAMGSANPVVITGSHNWTASADGINDENTLLIYDHEVANWFYQEYTQRYADLTTSISDLDQQQWMVYPNPATDQLWINAPQTGFVRVFDLQGREVMQEQVLTSPMVLNVEALKSGIYVIRFNGSAVKWVKE